MKKVKTPAENANTNPQSFQELSPVQKEVLPSHKLQVHPLE